MERLGKRNILQKAKDPAWVFCAVSLLGMAAVAVCIFASRGDWIRQYFFYNDRDTGMDFFHSIEYVKGRMPYGLFDTLYPPLANVFFYLLYLLIPKSISDNWVSDFDASVEMRGTADDLRSYQAPMLLFLLFVVIVVYALYVMTDKFLAGSVQHRKAVIFCALFSYGVLYGIERGNIILLCWVLMAFFLYYRNAESPILREAACLALAVAAGFKLYPAFLGLLLVKEKKTLPAIRTVLYGIAALVLPLYLFNEGLYGLQMWLEVVFGFGSDTQYPWVGNGFANIAANIGYFLDPVLGTSMAEQNYALAGIAVALVLLVCALFLKKEWEAVLALVLAMMMFQSQADYIYCLYLLPLLLFLAQEKRLDRRNALPFGVMLLFTVQLPLFHAEKATPFTLRNLLFQILLAVLLVWCLVRAFRYAASDRPRAVQTRLAGGCREALATVLVGVLVLAGNVAGQQVWEQTRNWGYDYVFNCGIGEEDGKTFTVQDPETGESLTATWSTDKAYFIVYNHAPITQTFRISFKTGYRMNRSRPHSMYFATDETSRRITLDENTDEVVYDLELPPGETRVGISYLGPKVVTENRKGEPLRMSFTAADFRVELVPAEE